MELIFDDQPRLLTWARQITGGRYQPGARAIGQRHGRYLNAVVVYDDISARNCNIHIASDGSGHWLTRRFLAAAFGYPFVDLGLARVTGLVPSHNRQALRFDIHLGFQLEGICREFLADQDMLILGMLRRDCRFIPMRYRS